MAGRAVRRFGWAVVPLAFLGYGLYLALGISGPTVSGPAAFSLDDVVWVLGQVAYATVGALVASRRPELPIGWLYSISKTPWAVRGPYGSPCRSRACRHALVGSGRYSGLAFCSRLVSQHCVAGAGRPAVSLRPPTITWVVGGGLGIGSRYGAGGYWHGPVVASQRHRAAGRQPGKLSCSAW